VNGYHKETASAYNEFSESQKAKYTKAGDDLYLKTPNGYKERLENFHKLKQHMGL
jgi:hypothetical protein